MSVLIYDSDKNKSSEKSLIFQNQGYTVYCAQSMEELNVFLNSKQINIILANWEFHLEEVRLLSVCKEINIPLLYYYDKWNEIEINQAFNLGASDILVFPFRPTELSFRIGKWENLSNIH